MPTPSAFHCLVFDLDDTLFPERDYVFSGFDAAVRHVAGFVGEARLDLATRAREIFESGGRGDVFNQLVAGTPDLPWPADAVVRMVEAYRGHVPKLELAPEVRALLRRLREDGRALGVITDGWLDVQRRKVAALGIDSLVDGVVYSDALGGRDAWKPSSLPFRALEAALNVVPAECLYIGDNPAKDFLGARNAGWRSLRLRIPGREHSAVNAPADRDADFHADSYSGLAQMLLSTT
ncbi:MAG: HAD-IA family hydrolase [Puniceicoccales bacterium]|nr:HAD-IA family hydrolase [Puniceicoccales bacterium]